MKNKKLMIAAVSIVLIGIVLTICLIPNSPAKKLLQELGMIDPPCEHSFGPYSLSGVPTYETPASLERTCTLCQEKETQQLYAATGLTYETDDEGRVHVANADGFTGKILYLSAKQKDGTAVHVVNESVFSERKIEMIILEEGIQAVNDYAFAYNDTLKQVYLPASITEYGSHAFAGCQSLTLIEFAKDATKLGVNQFYECPALTDVVLPDGVTDLPLGLFFGCKELTSVKLPANLVNIGADAFSACPKLANVTLPDTLKEIYPGSFAGCTSLTSLVIPSLNKLHYNAFLGCTGLKTVFLSGGIQEINVNGADGPFFCCDSSLVLYTDATEQPSGWNKHFENYNSNVADEDGGELDDSAYHNLKVVYGCPLSDFPG